MSEKTAMSGKEKDASKPHNLRSTSQSQKNSESPTVKKHTERMVEKGGDKTCKDPKQPHITDYQVESTEVLSITEELRKFRKEMKEGFSEINQNMEGRFKSMDNKFTDLFGGLREEVDQLKTEVQQSKTNIDKVNETVKEIGASMDFHAEELKDSEKNQQEKIKQVETSLDKKIAELDNKLMLLEKHDRKYNLLFYGIPEQVEEDPVERLQRLFIEELKIDVPTVDKMQFAHAHRIPSRGIGPKPLILKFINYQERELVLSHSKNLAGSKKRILTDLPEQMKKERNRLAKIAYEIRKTEQCQTRIKDRGLDLYLEVRKNSTEKWVKRDA